MNTYYVYILRCSDGSYYTGITNNVERRIEEHGVIQNPHAYLYKRRPFTLMYKAEFREVTEAIAWETKVKGWSRKKKEALIAKEYENLPALSMRQTPYQKIVSS